MVSCSFGARVLLAVHLNRERLSSAFICTFLGKENESAEHDLPNSCHRGSMNCALWLLVRSAVRYAV
jgi:hypothetical protein